jgi:MarR family transcriptional regulator, temperature-dependent positive regulator of motility
VASDPAGSPDTAPPAHGGSGDLGEHPGHLARRLHQMTYVVWSEVVSETVTPPQFVVLDVIDRHPGIDQTRLSAESHFDPSTIADVVRRLIGRGLVARERDASDRRRNVLELTGAGTQVLEDLRDRTAKMNEILLDSLSPDEQRAFLESARRVIAATERLVGDRVPYRR